jgi:hypothetical protein
LDDETAPLAVIETVDKATVANESRTAARKSRMAESTVSATCSCYRTELASSLSARQRCRTVVPTLTVTRHLDGFWHATNGSAATDSIVLAQSGMPLVALEDTALNNLRRRVDAEFLGTGEAEEYAWFPLFLLVIEPALAGRFGERAAGPTGIGCDLAAREDLAAGPWRRPARTDRPSSTTQPPARGPVRLVHDDTESASSMIQAALPLTFERLLRLSCWAGTQTRAGVRPPQMARPAQYRANQVN